MATIVIYNLLYWVPWYTKMGKIKINLLKIIKINLINFVKFLEKKKDGRVNNPPCLCSLHPQLYFTFAFISLLY